MSCRLGLHTALYPGGMGLCLTLGSLRPYDTALDAFLAEAIHLFKAVCQSLVDLAAHRWPTSVVNRGANLRWQLS